MISRRRLTAALLAVLLVAGCSARISGTARPAPVPPIMRVMLDGATLAKLLGQPFKSTPFSPPSYGGSELLGAAWGSATPAECIGVVFMMQKSVYRSVPVKGVADEMWTGDEHSTVKVNSVDESVISLPSAKDAAAAFATFSAQWQGCDGTTLTADSVAFAHNAISDVRLADSVVAASVLMQPPEDSILLSRPQARAIGVRDSYLVEVAVDLDGNGDPTAQGSGDIKTSAVDIAHAMMDRLALS
ncbi:MAG TPA: sensor domain-containing protein [Mycobacterium sp.]